MSHMDLRSNEEWWRCNECDIINKGHHDCINCGNSLGTLLTMESCKKLGLKVKGKFL